MPGYTPYEFDDQCPDNEVKPMPFLVIDAKTGRSSRMSRPEVLGIMTSGTDPMPMEDAVEALGRKFREFHLVSDGLIIIREDAA